MPNIQIEGHPLIGTRFIYRPASLGWEQYDPDLPDNRTGGTLIVGNGMQVVVKAVFQNWNDVPGLDMLYVFCTGTGYHTHVTPADLGLPPLTPMVEDRPEGWYYTGPIDAAKALLLGEYGDSISVVHRTDGSVLVCEHRGSAADNPNQWGVSAEGDEDEAWRYLAGADFGPVDEEYDEVTLRSALRAALGQRP